MKRFSNFITSASIFPAGLMCVFIVYGIYWAIFLTILQWIDYSYESRFIWFIGNLGFAALALIFLTIFFMFYAVHSIDGGGW